MSPNILNRRSVLLGMLAVPAVSSTPSFASSKANLHVLKDPSCGCCSSWIKIMRIAGFDVSVEDVSYEELSRHKQVSGISENLASCHTGTIEGYVIEGHVPPADVKRLLAERPEALGLTVPGMPMGSPGMGPESEREAYDVLLIKKNGSVELFARYEAA